MRVLAPPILLLLLGLASLTSCQHDAADRTPKTPIAPISEPTPREAAIWQLVMDFRALHFTVGIWKDTDRSKLQGPFVRREGHGKEERIVQVFPTLATYRADLLRRADSLRQTGPLNLSDTLYEQAAEAGLQRNANKIRRSYKEHPEYYH